MLAWWVRPAILVVILVGVGATGYWRGGADCEARHDAVELDLIEKERAAESERIRLQQERDELARKLEEEINETTVVIHRCLGPDRGVQLNRLH